MPEIRIDFTLLSNPTDPFAFVQGSIDVCVEPIEGEAVMLDWPFDIADIDGLHAVQRVNWMIPAEKKLAPLYVLEPVVMAERSAARALGEYWARRYDFDIDQLPFNPGSVDDQAERTG